MTIDKNFYNESSAKNLGWDPTWFGEKHYDDQLTRAIKKWQRERGLTADGLCGPATFRRIWTERQSNIDAHKPDDVKYSNYIGPIYIMDHIPVFIALPVVSINNSEYFTRSFRNHTIYYLDRFERTLY